MSDKKIPAALMDQTVEWPTGCESVSTVMLLHYLGIEIPVSEFVDRYLPEMPVPFPDAGGILHGPDPSRFFIGSPDDPESYGCYAPVIRNALTRLFADRGLPYRSMDLTGVPIDTLLTDYIDQDMPVIFWSTIGCQPYEEGPSWLLSDGNTFTWRSHEHCILLVGHGDGVLYFNDPLAADQVQAYPRDVIEQRHREQYSMAVSCIRTDG